MIDFVIEFILYASHAESYCYCWPPLSPGGVEFGEEAVLNPPSFNVWFP